MEKTCRIDIAINKQRHRGSESGHFLPRRNNGAVIFEAWLLISEGGHTSWPHGRITLYASPHAVLSKLNVNHM
jgi:hypothetical protein